MRGSTFKNHGTKEQKIKSFKNYVKEAVIAAKELYYDDDVINSIKSAKCVRDIERALCYGRNRKKNATTKWM